MLVVMPLVFWLLAALTLKHFVADFLLQTRWMAHGKEAATGWMLPLACHAGLHGAGTWLVALAFVPAAWWLAPMDMTLHAAIDFGKAWANRHFRLNPEQTAYWWLFGLDQFLHQVTNLVVAYIMLMAMAG